MPTIKESKTLREWIADLKLNWIENEEYVNGECEKDYGYFITPEGNHISVYNSGGYALDFSSILDYSVELGSYGLDNILYFMPNADIQDYSLKYDLNQDY